MNNLFPLNRNQVVYKKYNKKYHKAIYCTTPYSNKKNEYDYIMLKDINNIIISYLNISTVFSDLFNISYKIKFKINNDSDKYVDVLATKIEKESKDINIALDTVEIQEIADTYINSVYDGSSFENSKIVFNIMNNLKTKVSNDLLKESILIKDTNLNCVVAFIDKNTDAIVGISDSINIHDERSFLEYRSKIEILNELESRNYSIFVKTFDIENIINKKNKIELEENHIPIYDLIINNVIAKESYLNLENIYIKIFLNNKIIIVNNIDKVVKIDDDYNKSNNSSKNNSILDFSSDEDVINKTFNISLLIKHENIQQIDIDKNTQDIIPIYDYIDSSFDGRIVEINEAKKYYSKYLKIDNIYEKVFKKDIKKKLDFDFDL